MCLVSCCCLMALSHEVWPSIDFKTPLITMGEMDRKGKEWECLSKSCTQFVNRMDKMKLNTVEEEVCNYTNKSSNNMQHVNFTKSHAVLFICFWNWVDIYIICIFIYIYISSTACVIVIVTVIFLVPPQQLVLYVQCIVHWMQRVGEV